MSESTRKLIAELDRRLSLPRLPSHTAAWNGGYRWALTDLRDWALRADQSVMDSGEAPISVSRDAVTISLPYLYKILSESDHLRP